MNLETLRKRFVSRLTAAPEILYSVSRHWFLILLILCGGVGLAAFKVSLSPIVYEGRATLQLRSGDDLVVEQDKQRGESREEAQRFYASRVDMLLNDSVIREAMAKLPGSDIFTEREEGAEAVGSGFFFSLLNRARDRIQQALDILSHTPNTDASEEITTQRAINSFKRRVRVEPNPRTGTVALKIYGSDRLRMGRELVAWVDAYKNRLSEIALEGRKSVITGRVEFWQKKENEARNVLDEFTKQNPDVSKLALDSLIQQIFQYEQRRDDLLRERDNPALPPALVTTDRGPRDPALDDLKAQKNRLETELLEKLTIFGESSDIVSRLREQIRLINNRISGVDTVSSVTPADPAARKAQLDDQIAKYENLLKSLRGLHATRTVQLEGLQSLQAELQRCQRTLQDYRAMEAEELDRVNARQFGQVVQIDKPVIDAQPFPTNPGLQIAIGAAAGVVVGLAVSILLELLSSRVRFKHDIYSEFGLTVIGVLPRR